MLQNQRCLGSYTEPYVHCSTKADMYNLKSINIKDLEQISFLFPGDLYALASFVKRVDIEQSKVESVKHPVSMVNTTVNGLANKFSYMTGIPSETVKHRLREYGIELGAIIQSNDE